MYISEESLLSGFRTLEFLASFANPNHAFFFMLERYICACCDVMSDALVQIHRFYTYTGVRIAGVNSFLKMAHNTYMWAFRRKLLRSALLAPTVLMLLAPSNNQSHFADISFSYKSNQTF